MQNINDGLIDTEVSDAEKQIIIEKAKENEKKQLLNGDVFPLRMGLVFCKVWSVNKIKIEHARLLNVLSGSQSVEERDTWPVKAKLVEQYTSGTESQKKNAEAWLKKMLKKGEKLADYVAKIQTGINGNMELMTTAEGLKRNAEMAIDAAKSVEELEATMDAIKAQSKGAETAFKKALAAAA